jgi:glycosyltransferase involved in cell wall biosynthesis
VTYTVNAPFVGGAERSLIRIAGALDPARFKPHVITGVSGDLDDALRAARLPFREVPFPLPSWRRPWDHVMAIRRVCRVLKQQRTAIVHANDAPGLPVPARAARLTGIPVVCHVRYTYEAPALRYFLRHGFARAVFASQYMLQYARQQCPEVFPVGKCQVIYNGFEPPAVPGGDELEQLRRALNIFPGTPVVGFFGQVIEVKGVKEFLEAASLLSRHRNHVRFLIVGDDKQQNAASTYRRQMEALARELGIAASCTFTGFRTDVWDLMHVVDLVAMPSRVEPLGNVAIETAAARRPIVATAVGGLVEVIEHERTGLLVAPRAPEALAAALGTLLDHPNAAREMADEAARRVAIRFSMRAQSQATQDLYDEALLESVR